MPRSEIVDARRRQFAATGRCRGRISCAWRRLSDRKRCADGWKRQMYTMWCRGCGCDSLGLKVASQTVRIWRHVYQVRSLADAHASMAAGDKVQLTSQLRRESIVQKDINSAEVWQWMHAINTPRVSLNDDRYSAKSYSRKSTTDGKKTLNYEKALREKKTANALAAVRRSQKFPPRRRTPSRGRRTAKI